MRLKPSELLEFIDWIPAIVENSRMRSDTPLLHGEITSSIIDSFFEVHGELGFGFREYIYARAWNDSSSRRGTESTEK